MNIHFSTHDSKAETFKKVEDYLTQSGFKIVKQDSSRPWGGFFVVDETQAKKFADLFFQGISLSEIKITERLSPKILLVQPGKRLSWQYHHRRAEIWKLVAGEAGIIKSDTDEEGELHPLRIGEIVRLNCGERHRLIGLQSWGMISEIWQHTDANHLSDEDDIVRVQDDFGR